ncbi:DUF6011 domain-containing protein [Mesorhizobium sp. WSM3862]|uniref:DUF6011 domain-containing protein n=1 Tax=Mesorhizobium sp. WSM3862 TaxID=632858 RepID=UPI000BAF279F|nr:DUF6011 domain-containing protein [Mesorhizobium sp. WSM3862]PBB96718.1 hypothetical protein CK224_20745 [Mesorhizobium sp. WSM3862]
MNLEIEALRQSAPKLHGRDAEFAASLLHQYDSRSSLSERQWPWVATLTQRAQAGEPAAPKAKVGSMDGLIALFDTAIANKLKHPKIRFDVNGETVVLALAGARSAHAGQINVSSPGSFESRDWYGRIDRKGEFTRSRRSPGPDGLVSALTALAENPSKAGAAHGKRTGNCCFCAIELTDHRSIDVGYGPVCAKRWGLAWG